MNICGTDRDPAGVTCAPGYAQFIAARQAAGLPVPPQSASTSGGDRTMLYVFAALAAVLLLRR